MISQLPAVFGPVPSRRLGLSLGIDLLDFKTCSLDCVYCELGTTAQPRVQRSRFRYYKQVLGQVEERLAQLSAPPDSLTLGGSGEPTLHLDLGLTLEGLAMLAPIRKVVLTNATLMHLPEVRRDLAKADLVVPSLDAVSEEVFNKINRPAPGLNPQTILQGIKDFRREFNTELWLEILLVRGLNDSESELARLRQAAWEIKPDLVQLNTIVRPPAMGGFFPVAPERLQAIAQSFSVPAQVIASPSACGGADRADPEQILTQTTRMRPCTKEDLLRVSGLSPEALEDRLQQLLTNGQLLREHFDGREYYRGNL